MAYFYIPKTLKVPVGPKELVRKKLIQRFLKEHPGTGKGSKASRYEYKVDVLSCGSKVLLRRPAPRNNGMDFIFRIENLSISGKKRLRDVPSHNDALSDLNKKVSKSPARKKILCAAIQSAFACQPITQTLNSSKSHGSFSEEQLIYSFKWMFIEQDVTYWNKSGRQMLMDEIVNRGLC